MTDNVLKVKLTNGEIHTITSSRAQRMTVSHEVGTLSIDLMPDEGDEFVGGALHVVMYAGGTWAWYQLQIDNEDFVKIVET